jgi:hypothetical protein
VCLLLILSNKLDLNQETRFIIQPLLTCPIQLTVPAQTSPPQRPTHSTQIQASTDPQTTFTEYLDQGSCQKTTKGRSNNPVTLEHRDALHNWERTTTTEPSFQPRNLTSRSLPKNCTLKKPSSICQWAPVSLLPPRWQ